MSAYIYPRLWKYPLLKGLVGTYDEEEIIHQNLLLKTTMPFAGQPNILLTARKWEFRIVAPTPPQFLHFSEKRIRKYYIWYCSNSHWRNSNLFNFTLIPVMDIRPEEMKGKEASVRGWWVVPWGLVFRDGSVCLWRCQYGRNWERGGREAEREAGRKGGR